ncbi:MAG: hypothetical protein KC621_31795, partial [Myxococcales bacterium]|nr:hypothetical protein [Myxococcales bacterium]
DTDADTDTTHTGETGTVPVSTVSATCTQTLHPQVFDCTVELSDVGDATLTFTAAGAVTREFHSDAPALVHHFYGWGLLSSTTYDWDAGDGITGQVSTGPISPDLRSPNLTITHSGTLTGADAVMVYTKCGYFVLMDGDANILWYQPTTVYDSFLDAMRWSAADHSMIAVKDSAMSPGQSEVQEVDLGGNELLHLTTADFRLKLTHDVDRWHQYTYLLGENPQNRMGGFEVFDGTTKVGEFLLTDAFPNITNTHVNGISVSESGEVILSELNYNAILGIDGDPASPTFLQMLWHSNGAPGGGADLPNPDLEPASGTIYRGQHNASRHGDELWVFDNRSRGSARGLRMSMDFASGEIAEIDSWSTGETCFNQGGAQPMDGGALVTCANSDNVYAFRDNAATPEWEMLARCGGFPGSSSTRAYPVWIR